MATNLMQLKLRRALNRHRTQTALAKDIGVSLPQVNSVLKGRKRPGPKILEYLGLEEEVVVRYRPVQRTERTQA